MALANATRRSSVRRRLGSSSGPTSAPVPQLPTGRYHVVLIGLLVLTTAACKLPEALLPIASDTGMFATYGRLLTAGARPYITFWDVHPPLVYGYWWVVSLVAGADWTHVMGWATLGDSVLSVATAWCVYLSARRLDPTSPGPAIAGVCVAVFANLSMFSQEGNNPTKLGLLPSAFAVYTYTRGLTTSGRSAVWLVAAGGAAAVAILAKQPCALLLVGLTVHSLWQAVRSNGRFSDTLELLAGAAAVGVLTIIIFAWIGALSDLIAQVWTYNIDRLLLGYWHSSGALKAPSLRLDRLLREAGAAVFVTGLIGGLAVAVRPAHPRGRLPLWWAVASIGAIVGFREFEQIVPSFAWLAGIAVSRLWAGARSQGLGLGHPLVGRLAIVMLLGSILALSSHFQVSQVQRLLYERGPGRGPASSEIVASTVRQTIEPGPIFVWGNAAHIYALSGRDPASRFVNGEAVRATAPHHDSSRQILIDELYAAAPGAIVFAPHSNEADLRVDQFPALGNLIAECYARAIDGMPLDANWSLYRLRHDVPNCPSHTAQ